VRLDPYPRTIDLLRGEAFDDPIFVVGADEFCNFRSWKEPDAVLELTRLGVATRPGYPRERLQTVLDALARPGRVELFDIAPNAAASREIRAAAAAGETLDSVPEAVAALIRERRFYARD
jgi:nicotinic acid mononucleotide adenylyltransferase